MDIKETYYARKFELTEQKISIKDEALELRRESNAIKREAVDIGECVRRTCLNIMSVCVVKFSFYFIFMYRF